MFCLRYKSGALLALSYMCEEKDEEHILRRVKWFIRDLTRRVELMADGEANEKGRDASKDTGR